MTFTQTTDFVGSLFIPNLDNSIVLENVNYFIEQTENKIAIDLFGFDLWNQFLTGIAENSPDQKWLDLRDGAIYQNEYDVSFKWSGLADLFKYFVYYDYMKSKQSTSTQTGEQIFDSLQARLENRLFVSNKLIPAYNEGVKRFNNCIDFINYSNYNEEIYTNFSTEKILNANYLGI